MISDSKKENFNLFCKKTESYGVCDKISGDDKHKRIHMGTDEHSRVRYYGCLRKDYMKVFYRSTEKVDTDILHGSNINIPTTESGFEYYSEIKPEDYDAFLNFVSIKLGRRKMNASMGINTPAKPKDIITGKDGIIKYICGRCGKSFIKSQRCPECGQLVKE